MIDYIRDTPLGQLIRLLSGNSILQYPDERPRFVYLEKNVLSPSTETASLVVQIQDKGDLESQEKGVDAQRATAADSADNNLARDFREALAQPATTAKSSDPASQQIALVDWYSGDDAENPQNWSSGKKAWVTFLICFYTFVVYFGSSVYLPSSYGIMKAYNVSETVASLGLALYVLGYGVGPMIFSPLSEIASIGRNIPYVTSFVLFFVVSVVASVVDNFSALMVLRFLQGFFGSPCLASGGATLQDMYDWFKVPYAFIIWIAALYCGPALGPLLSGYAVIDDWRWSLWEIVFLAAPVLILLACTLPETSTPTILLHRAQRLRKTFNNPNIRAASEFETVRFGAVLMDALIKPTEIAIKDPAVAFACVYGSLVYGTYYSFFEAFPIVYVGMYGMSAGGMGLIFLNVIVGTLISASAYSAYLFYVFEPKCRRQEMSQESRLAPALIGVFILPMGLFLFAWTARPTIHWIWPTIGVSIYAGSSFVVFQCIIVYVPLSYPKYTASLFASNDFLRSTFAAGTVMYSRAMYLNLGIDRGVSLLAGLSVLGIIGMFFWFYYGAKLRAMSKFAVS